MGVKYPTVVSTYVFLMANDEHLFLGSLPICVSLYFSKMSPQILCPCENWVTVFVTEVSKMSSKTLYNRVSNVVFLASFPRITSASPSPPPSPQWPLSL